MIIFLDDFYKNFHKQKKIINFEKIKKTIYFICINNNNCYLPIKLKYFIVYLIKYDCKFNIINKIIKKILYNINYNLSKFIYNIIIYKWINIINISINNNVQSELINYFFDLYDLYLKIEKCSKLFIIQTKHILGIRIGYIRHLKKYLTLNIYDTIYYIDIIFSKLDKKYLQLKYIFDEQN
jgi:hypothetical protein